MKIKTIPGLGYWSAINQKPRLKRSRRTELARFSTSSNTLVSILIPVFNPDLKLLAAAVASATSQTHTALEVMLINDCSTAAGVEDFCRELQANTPSVRLINLEKNLGISGASQVGLVEAKGLWVGLLDQDDLLASDAVEKMLFAVESEPGAILAYSDSDKIGLDGKLRDEFRKPDWSPERLRGNMYLAHFTFFKKSAAIELGGFRSEFDGAQDHDLALRLSEISRNVIHVPEVLYHWRMTPTSTALNPEAKSYAVSAGQRAIQAHLSRSEISATTLPIENYPGFYRNVRVPRSGSKVSIVIPTRGGAGNVLGETKPFVLRCIESISKRPSPLLDEVILVADKVQDMSYLDVAEELLPGKIRVVEYHKDFNFSEKVNLGISAARNNIIFLLNDDIQLITENWLEQLVAIVEQPTVGTAGPLLLFEDETIQHAGHFYAFLGATHRYLGEQLSPGYFGDLILEHEVSGLTAAFLVFRKEVWEEVAGFSLDFPNNFNDVDFCLKVTEQGLSHVFTPEVVAFHFESKTRDTNVTPGEVMRIQELWSHRLGTFREPFGPGGKPKGFGENNFKLHEHGYKDPKHYQFAYKFNLIFDPEIEAKKIETMKTQFALVSTDFKSIEFDVRPIKEIDIVIRSQIIFGWNFLHEMALAFDSGLSFIYSDYVNSLSVEQNLIKLPAWSPERFLSTDFLGSCFALSHDINSVDENLNFIEWLKWRNSMLMDSEKSSIGRIPEILYRTVALFEQSAFDNHAEWVTNYLASNRPGAKMLSANRNPGLRQISYADLAKGDVSVVIPTRFSSEEAKSDAAILTCLKSIASQRLGTLKLSIQIVYDTDADMHVLAQIQEQFTSALSIDLIPFDEQFNFAKKCNLGALSTNSESILFLNDDTEFLTDTSLQELIGNLSAAKEIGAVGALLRYPNGLIQHAGIIMATPGPGHAYLRQSNPKSDIGDAFVGHEVSGVTGACIAVRREIFNEIGGWNEEFPSSFNDVDFCLKIRHLGKSIILNPLVELTHFESLSRNPYATNTDLGKLNKYFGRDLAWEPYLRTGLVHGFDDEGTRIGIEVKKDLSGKYAQYAIYLLRSYGVRALVQTVVRRVFPSVLKQQKIENTKSYF